jgi:hypothetical protein
MGMESSVLGLYYYGRSFLSNQKKYGRVSVFLQAKSEGNTSTNPLKESFGNRYNLKFVLLALFGATMGQGVVWYTGQFYAMSFMKTVMSLDSSQVDTLLGIALILGTPFLLSLVG